MAIKNAAMSAYQVMATSLEHSTGNQQKEANFRIQLQYLSELAVSLKITDMQQMSPSQDSSLAMLSADFFKASTLLPSSSWLVATCINTPAVVPKNAHPAKFLKRKPENSYSCIIGLAFGVKST